MTDNNKKDPDELSGVETTGHEWDGLKELNNPMPRWWLWTFFVCCIWSVGYWVVYPAWPTLSGEGERGGTVGSMEWTQYKELKEGQAEIVARKAGYLKKFHAASFEEILASPELYAFAVAGGKSAFKDNCATCHGSGGAGAKGYPNLNDDDWIWGGTHTDIYQTLKFGIRANHPETRDSMMPAFAGIIPDIQIETIADFIISLRGSVKMEHPGYTAFQTNCASCHSADGSGIRELGTPNLADAIWLKSDGNKASIISQIKNPKHGMMPNWNERLDEDTLRQLTVYVHSLGGGE
ncbi:MAG: cytochrome-c oxidase, cbb3-type subunit III [Rickettsiales bacterium]|nr:cytochrome-c oxidase, cbb3-type subunit III [Rickettsiales bacterium]